jgi:alpha-beta hydrolase superfamily lysophospholipase
MRIISKLSILEKTIPAACLAAIAVGISGCASQPLEPWHTVRLQEEFTAGMVDEVRDLAGYLELEDRLFAELEEEVYAEVETGPEYALVRYSSGSAADPRRRQQDFNRTFELKSDNPRGGVLLLHGLSDSPYSLRALGEKLHQEGFQVIGLRLPGHGTAPSALMRVKWQDMAAAVRLAMDHLVEQLGDKPIHIAGYSTGAPLALNLSLDAIEDPNQRAPSSLILVSPAIGVSAAAAVAGPTAAIGRVPGLTRVGWASINPEFDPYKYNSFTVNAGSQVHRLTRSVANRVARLARSGNIDAMPPILVFKSTVDATVSTGAVVDRLLAHFSDNGNEFVLFDINRFAVTSILLVSDPGPFTNRLMDDPALPFAIRLIANENPESRNIVAHFKPAYSSEIAETETLDLAWPAGIISLSHVALPFPPDDPLYGRIRPEREDLVFLGQIEIRGERGLMRISNDWLLRLRYNPFYSVLEQRVLEWLDALGTKP